MNITKQIITLWSVGSVGKTTLSLNLAQKMAKESGLKIGLLDFAVLTPCIHLFLELEDKNSSIEYILKSWQDDFAYRKLLEENAYISKDIPNLLCWTGLTKNPELIDKLGTIQAQTIISELSQIVDILFIDVQSDTLLVPTDISLKMATKVITVVDQNRNTIENTAKWLNNLYTRKLDIKKFSLVINQYSDKVAYSKNKIESNLGLSLLGTIPAIPKAKYDNLTVTLGSLSSIRNVNYAIEKILTKLNNGEPVGKPKKVFRLPIKRFGT
jgi:MinD-like ATPase involved in chromosome partitioning or flagellar assembly